MPSASVILDRIQKQKTPVRVGFLVIFDSVFQGEPLFRKMLEDDRYAPFILVIPDISRGAEHEIHQKEQTFRTLSKRYPQHVQKSWDEATNTYIDYSDEMDLVCSANPYDGMTHQLYSISYLHQKTLPVYFNYGYPSSVVSQRVASSLFYSLQWFIFCESPYLRRYMAQHMLNKGSNLKLCGYIKMDDLAKVPIIPRERKLIIIAPHHTILPQDDDFFGISAFLKMADYLAELPIRYPQIDFVFRPHPLLKTKLALKEIWGAERANAYYDAWNNHPNSFFQNGGPYFETFANSDGMIHDCSSFMAEYLYVEKPVCFILKDENIAEKFFIDNGKEILNHSYLAKQQGDIDYFINEIILKGNDSKKEARIQFTKEEIAYNYPHATDTALKIISNALFGKGKQRC